VRVRTEVSGTLPHVRGDRERLRQVPEPDLREVRPAPASAFIARSIVEAHGGWLDVESQPDEGSTFTVELPVGE
jgi:hypothetical protein